MQDKYIAQLKKRIGEIFAARWVSSGAGRANNFKFKKELVKNLVGHARLREKYLAGGIEATGLK